MLGAVRDSAPAPRKVCCALLWCVYVRLGYIPSVTSPIIYCVYLSAPLLLLLRPETTTEQMTELIKITARLPVSYLVLNCQLFSVLEICLYYISVVVCNNLSLFFKI